MNLYYFNSMLGSTYPLRQCFAVQDSQNQLPTSLPPLESLAPPASLTVCDHPAFYHTNPCGDCETAILYRELLYLGMIIHQSFAVTSSNTLALKSYM